MDQRERVAEHFGVRLSRCEEPQFLWYRTGDFFVAHQDGNTGLVRLDSDKSRLVSVSIFLNQQSETAENDSYSGGSLVFSDWRLDTRFDLAGEAGTLVAFRSEITHEVTPVTHGERYAIVSWYA
jgi:SM-20-related protein